MMHDVHILFSCEKKFPFRMRIEASKKFCCSLRFMFVPSWFTNDHCPERLLWNFFRFPVCVGGKRKLIWKKVLREAFAQFAELKTLGLVLKGSKNVAKCSFLLLFLELHRHFASSRSDHQTHIVKFHPLWWRAMKMLILWDFYETRNLCFFPVALTSLAEDETFVLSCTKREKIEGTWRATWCLNTRSEPLTKLRTWREFHQWCERSIFETNRRALVDFDRRSCQYRMQNENGSLRQDNDTVNINDVAEEI